MSGSEFTYDIHTEEPSKTGGYMKYVGLGWLGVVGGSITYSMMTKKHLSVQERIFHSRIHAQAATLVAAIGVAILSKREADQKIAAHENARAQARAAGHH
eukprot:TRINITY_DN2133_c0_g1::TRINITY_DN2133_c0_g1_i1::g.12719::m.12719 TRINITY_DN2133_c0_g1::TRINITY_DN2133_c0_g1_i1::g.12719  ORF type:complete len:117 (+),score=26.46,HIG_1_N/PF04588.8/4.5e-05,DUF3938/PF13074.1/0.095,Paf67/PF10255.4/0.072 TRINITY_DN2133_c0_g1_i1:54-353(+)